MISTRRLEMFVCALVFVTIELSVLPVPAAAKEPTGVADFAFVDPLHGWVSIEAPVPAILCTSDGGAHWTRSRLPFKRGFYLVRFFDLKTGVAVMDPTEDETLIYRTTDGGHAWNKIVRVEKESLVITGATFVTADQVFVVGEGPMGIGWVAQVRIGSGDIQVRDDLPVDFSAQSNTLDVFGDGNHHMWIVGKQLILHSSDDGKTWENQYANSVPRLDLGFSGTALLGGAWFTDGDLIYMTHDDGGHW